MTRYLGDKRLWIGGLVGLCLVVAIAAAGFFAWQQMRPAGPTTTSDPNNDGVTSGPEIRVETGNATTGGASAGPAGVISEGPIIGQSGAGRFSFRLSEGQAVPEEAVVLTVVGGEPLSAEDTQAVLDRLPPLAGEEGDETDFNLPPDLLPPPQPGETVAEPFPAPQPPFDASEETAGGPLEVLRFAPEGEIPIAPFLNVTFNQPMVPLGTVEQLATADVPVNISPAIPGEWRWLGTTTLSFVYAGEAGDRFPMATEYVVEIPAGTTSQTGGVLSEAVTWRFSTPPVQLENSYPFGDSQPLETLIFAQFDQQIDPAAVLATTAVTADGDPVSVQQATDEEIAADETIQRLVERTPAGRWLALRPVAPLPQDAGISVTFNPGTPSAEGPLTTTEAQSFTFHTYGPLQITDHTCGYYDEECPPLTPFYIEFSNSLDMDAFDPAMISIEPPLAGAVVRPQGRRLEIRGLTAGRTRYQVTISGNIQDDFGQMMGSDETLTFRVGSANNVLIGPDRPFVTLDPAAPRPVLSVYTVNYDELNVEIYAVEPAFWVNFRQYLDEYYREENPPTPPGEKVVDSTITIDAADDELAEVPIDLSAALDGDYGHLVVIVSPPGRLFENWRERPVVQTWVQVTEIGLDAVMDSVEVTAWTTALADGAPLSGVKLELAAQGPTVSPASATTGPDGTATLPLSENGAAYLLARQGEDTALLVGNPYYYSADFWQTRSLDDELRWYIMDDRNLYQPGEEVHVKGWIRRVGGGPAGDVGLATGSDLVTYAVTGPQGNEIHSGEVNVTALGGFDFQFSLPEESNLGYAEIMFNANGSGDLNGRTYYHPFQIQEFRRPEFEVTARAETAGPYFVGDSATVATTASYFAGGPLPNADVSWQVSASPGSYNPPNWPDFIFGTWTPWWFDYGGYYDEVYYAGDIAIEEPFFPPEVDGGYEQTFEGVTDANGEHYLQIDFESLDTPQPFSLRAQATVFDVNRQAWSAATNLLVHPADLYVGLRSETTFVRQGDPLEIAAIVTDIDGAAVSGREITIVAGTTDWEFRDGRYQEVLVDEQTCTVTSSDEPVTCTFDTSAGGQYQITATVTDSQDRTNQSQFTRWVSGGKQPPAREVEQEQAILVPDKQTYNPGDTAQILVSAPWDNGEGLLTVTRSGILYQERFALTGGSATLAIPIQEAYLPNINVQVDLVGAAPRTDDAGETLEDAPARPAYATGYLTLDISTRSRELDIDVSPAVDALEPGGETNIEVLVTDDNGAPVPNAEMAVIVVDEAILALSNYDPANPLSVFYRNRGSDISSFYGRASMVLARPEALPNADLNNDPSLAYLTDDVARDESVEEVVVLEADIDEFAEMPASQAAATAILADQQGPIQVRSDFNPLAAFVPAATTDGDGRASVPVKLPDNLTRYRVLVVAVAGDNQFGQGESNLTARLPLMVRPSAPRFLNFGDRFELPIVLQNQTNEPMTVDVVVETTNLRIVDGANGVRVVVPANDRVEVRFPTETAGVGIARFQIGAVSGSFADAAAVSLPVYTPATTEAFATYGVLDTGAVAQPILAPTDVFTQFGELEIQTSSTALQALTDAVIYLANYPYESAPQIASRVLAVAALRDVLTAFEAEQLPEPAVLETQTQADIDRLVALQNPDGGWPAWSRYRESVPFYGIHVTHALVQAQEKGFSVPAGTLEQARFYLQNIEDHYYDYYGVKARHTLSAYALHVRRLMGDSDPLKAARILDEAGGIEQMPLEGLAWLWPVLGDDPANDALVADISRHFSNRAVETAGAANFIVSYDDDAYLLLHSNRRTDGVILDALIEMDPDSDLIPKVVAGLLANQERGRWDNTQENVFILLALDRYFNTFETQTPDFVANIWLGETYAGGHEYEGRTTERHQTDVPLAYLAAEDPGQLIISKDGEGRLYYRLGLNYAPADLELDALDRGFVVERRYEAVDDPEDVRQNEDGSWTIRAGARVRVNITLVARSRRYHVALVDPLPAGLEIINPALSASQDIPNDPNARSYWWYWTWYDHQNLRDHQAEAFSTLLWDGVYNYSYVARATTPGTFVVPPAKAEEMYAPETFGRSASDLVIIE